MLIGIRPRRFPPSPTIREDEDERVNGPEGQGVGPGRDPGERQAEAARREMHDVVPAVDLENAVEVVVEAVHDHHELVSLRTALLGSMMNAP